jgi:opacity protein-like surface antigen
MKRFLLVVALALGLLAASAPTAVADEHAAKRSNWSHDGTKVYTTTAVNQHNQYGDLQGILKFRQRRSVQNTGNFDIQIDYVRLYRVLPDRSGLLVVEDNTDQNLLVTWTWTYVNSGWQACGPNLPIGWYYVVSRFQLIHKHIVGAYDFSGWRFVRTAKWHYDGRCF